MPRELPIACSLDASELAERGGRWRALADRGLIEASLRDGVAVQRYRADTEVLAELRELIRLEGECCPFLDFALSEGEGEIRLEVSGPTEAGELIAAFAGERRQAGASR